MVTGRAPVKLPYPFPLNESTSKGEQERLYLDFQALAEQGKSTRWATLVIAPGDATTASKEAADYVCDGVADDVEVRAAVAAIGNRAQIGKIIILEGNLFFSARVDVGLDTGEMVAIEGMGSGSTIIHGSGLSGAIRPTGSFASGGGYLYLKDLGFIDSGGGDCVQANAGAVEATGCSFTTSGIGCFLDGGLSGPYLASNIHDCTFNCGARAVEIRHQFGARICDNTMMAAGTATTIRSHADAAATGRLLITNNDIAGQVGIWLNDSQDSTYSQDTVIVGNRFQTSGTAVQANATANTAILSNTFRGCGRALDVGSGVIQGDVRGIFANNFVYGTTGTRHVKVGSSTIGTTDWSIIFNRFYGTAPAYSVEIGSATSNNCVAFNDCFQGYTTAPLLDNGSATRTEEFFLPSTLSVNARVGVRVNTGGVTYLRRRINFIPGSSDVVISHADDSVDEEVDLTIGLAASLDVNARVAVRKNSTGSTYKRRRMNLIEGTGIAITIADDAVDEEVDITIAATAGAGTGDVEGQIIANFDAGGGIIAANKICRVQAPFSGTLDTWKIYADTVDTITVEIWKDIYANYPPTGADKISAAAGPSLTAADHNSGTVATWTSTAIAAGDVFYIKVTAVTLASQLLVVLHYTRP